MSVEDALRAELAAATQRSQGHLATLEHIARVIDWRGDVSRLPWVISGRLREREDDPDEAHEDLPEADDLEARLRHVRAEREAYAALEAELTARVVSRG